MNLKQLEQITDMIGKSYKNGIKIAFQSIANNEKWSKEKREEWKDILDIK